MLITEPSREAFSTCSLLFQPQAIQPFNPLLTKILFSCVLRPELFDDWLIYPPDKNILVGVRQDSLAVISIINQ